eukprot:CAMPEP_0113522430 /NCGR_PEP_ID=MMETSP0014_2-20120614/45185_1 /TAXON_ID=2857 /ORGANISM="Nitzschia sp." /LENGTH=555 /DNA_ID=CAMNT_0000420487 /DNA_START=1 /DNA_END=1668 /DNA_ORIENTATION=- /assembly_acc=CAM_ASM_000159
MICLYLVATSGFEFSSVQTAKRLVGRRPRKQMFSTKTHGRPISNLMATKGSGIVAFSSDTTKTGICALNQHQRMKGWQPYVERYEEYVVRKFWELQSFETSSNLVESIVQSYNQNNHDRRRKRRFWLQKVPLSSLCGDGLDHESQNPSGYEDLFDNVYSVCKQPGADEDEDETTRTSDKACGSSNNNNNHKNNDHTIHLRLKVAYVGDAFCGYQVQIKNNLPSIQGTLEDCLTEIMYRTTDTADAGGDSVDEKIKKEVPQDYKSMPNKKQIMFDKRKNRRASIQVAGRTDAGVHAIGQICRLRVYRRDMEEMMKLGHNPGDSSGHEDGDSKMPTIVDKFHAKVRQSLSSMDLPVSVTDITEVDRSFHPSFTSSCRAYVYLVDLTESPSLWSTDDMVVLERRVDYLNKLLTKLEGKPLKYIGLSYGKLETQDSTRTLFHARARLVRMVQRNNEDESWDQSEKEGGAGRNNLPKMAVCIELVGNGFLRRMVRLLVECVFQIVARQEQQHSHLGSTLKSVDDSKIKNVMALVDHIEQHDRQLLNSFAPPSGLIFVGAR